MELLLNAFIDKNNKIQTYLYIYDKDNKNIIYEEEIDINNKILFRQTIFLLSMKFNIRKIKYNPTGVGIIFSNLLSDIFLPNCSFIEKKDINSLTIHSILANNKDLFDEERICMRIDDLLKYNTDYMTEEEYREYNTLLLALS